MAELEVDPRWTALANKLRGAVDELDDAVAKHKSAIAAAKAALDAAQADLAAATQHVETLVHEVSETPPGTFPAITG